MIRRVCLIGICCLFIVTSCHSREPQGASIQGKDFAQSTEKSVIMVMIDSMTADLLDAAKEEGIIPGLSFLMENGTYFDELIAPFPSMSVVIESTLITGSLPDEHKVPGLVWYHAEEDRLVDYGSTPETYMKLGLNRVLFDDLSNLNNRHLSKDVPTIHEILQDSQMSTGSVNALVYRGNTSHKVNLPEPFDTWMQGQPFETKGPDLLSFGTIIEPKVIQAKELDDDHFLDLYGLNDSYGTAVVRTLIEKNEQPQFLFLFMPDFDQATHDHGQLNLEDFEKVDHAFQDILNSYDSWEQALEENIFIVIGDHGQSQIASTASDAIIPLPTLYEEYEIASLMDAPSDGEIVIANNHRMVYVYSFQPAHSFDTLANEALEDLRIQFAAYLEDDELVIKAPEHKEPLKVKKGGSWIDPYGQTWTIEGNEQIGDVFFDHDCKRIMYGENPDLFNQLFHALDSHTSTLVLTAKPGYIFESEGAPTHIGGGEHGGIHEEDTKAAMIIAGTDKAPAHLRMVDLKDFIIRLMTEEN